MNSGFGYHDSMPVSRSDGPCVTDQDKVSAWRYGFRSGARYHRSDFGDRVIFGGLTEYGLNRKASDFGRVIQLGIFDLNILRRLCESPLSDAIVENLIHNAINIQLHGCMYIDAEYELVYEGYVDIYGRNGRYWAPGGGKMLLRRKGCRAPLGAVYDDAVACLEGYVPVVPFEEEFYIRDTYTIGACVWPRPKKTREFSGEGVEE